MAAILVEHYQNLTYFYSEAQNQLVGLADYYYLAALEIVMLQVFDPEIDLLSPFYQAYLAADSAYFQPPTAVYSAVQALQRHILQRARTDPAVDPDGVAAVFTTVDEWLDAGATNGFLSTAVGRQGDVNTSIQVESNFATLSATAGYAIDSSNIM